MRRSGPRYSADLDAVVAQRRQRRLDYAFGVQMRLGILRFGLVVVLENIRQTQRPDLEPGIRQSLVGCNRQHMRAEAADRAFLYRDEQFVVRRQLADQITVQARSEGRRVGKE